MVKLYTVKELLELEKEANAAGLSYAEMMENAGRGIAEEVIKSYQNIDNKKVFALVGSGNNGGDALVALTNLSSHDWETCAYLVRKRDPEDPILGAYKNTNGKIIKLEQDKDFEKLDDLIHTNSVCLDGVLGTGIKLPLKGDIANCLAFVNDRLSNNDIDLHVLAVDCPSGIDCDTGEVAMQVIPAEITVTMAGLKVGMTKSPAARMSGEVRFTSIGNINGLDAYKNNPKIILTRELISQLIPKRPSDAHKGTFGTAFIIAGSVNYTGAALLAGFAAYRSGAGLVTMAIPEILHNTLAGQFPESTWVLLPYELGVISAEAAGVVIDNINKATAVLFGPGFGTEDTTKNFIHRMITTRGEQKNKKIGFIQENKKGNDKRSLDLPLVVDADGLKLISQIKDWFKLITPGAILTPHPGEMSIMTGLSVNEIQQNRIEIAEQYAKTWGHIIVLKGAYTVIAAPDGQLAILPVATAALARAGTGDVLAGLIVGLRAQGVSPFNAACAGSWIHANAGILAGKRLGSTASVIASDVLNAVPEIMSEIA